MKNIIYRILRESNNEKFYSRTIDSMRSGKIKPPYFKYLKSIGLDRHEIIIILQKFFNGVTYTSELGGVVEDKNGKMRPKTFYTDAQKREFIDLVFGQWHYFADTKSLTKATFSMDIPTKAIKILTYKNDIVLDPFAGSGTSLVAAEVLDRQWIGIELSPDYAEVARKRVNTFVLEKQQQVIEL